MSFFITFEGIEGSGKSSQVKLLKDHLTKEGRDVLLVREPGGTVIGEEVRSILLNKEKGDGMDSLTELLLYEACRVEIVKNVIKPALENGQVVICDRFTDSTVSYQGYARGLDIELINSLNEKATDGIKPDLTLLIDLPVEDGLRRANARIDEKETGNKEDRFEQEGTSFHEKVRGGFLEIAENDPKRVKIVDGGREISAIHRDICDILGKINF